VGDKIDLAESDNDFNCADEPRDYPTPKSLGKQTNLDQNNVSSELNQAATPSKTLIEPFQRRIKAGRTIILSERARENL
jgi:hypothetical protein